MVKFSLDFGARHWRCVNHARSGNGAIGALFDLQFLYRDHSHLTKTRIVVEANAAADANRGFRRLC
jgi:hypothetical protein